MNVIARSGLHHSAHEVKLIADDRAGDAMTRYRH